MIFHAQFGCERIFLTLFHHSNNNYDARPGGPGGPDGWGPAPGQAPDYPPQQPPQRQQGGWSNNRNFDRNAYGNPASGGGHARGSGDGQWRDGKHIPGPPNPRVERELFGTPDDPSKQHTGINFEKYDDIPVEASGHDVPEPVLTFSNPPLEEHLIRNIELARYKVPTPVQKYSIPTVSYTHLTLPTN